MIGRLLRFAFQQRFITIVVTIALIALGIYCFQQLKVEAYPDISDTQVVVITAFPGQAAEETEQQITIPIERALNSVPNLIARRSRTIYGLSVAELTFTYETNDYFARQVVLERLRDAQLPEGVTPQIAPLTTPIGEMYRFRLDGPGRSDLELREIEDWIVAPRLLQVPGVADVVPFGGLVKQYQVEVSPPALAKYGLSVKNVVDAIQANNRNAGGALLSTGQQSMVIRGVGRIRSVTEIENIVLLASGGVPVLVQHIVRNLPQTKRAARSVGTFDTIREATLTGASGAPYGVRLLEVLLAAGRAVHLSLSPAAAEVIEYELGRRVRLDHFDPA